MPDYQIMRWDERNFDINYCTFTREAYSRKKYAYVADVARLVALSKFGGIYLDTDVEVFKRFDEFLLYNFFSGIELYNEFYFENIQKQYLNKDGSAKNANIDVPHLEILTSSMGCTSGLKVISDIINFYKSLDKIEIHSSQDFRTYVNFDRLVARHLSQYGFRYKDETQHFGDNMVVFGTGTFGHEFCPTKTYTVSYHHNATTWDSEKWSKRQKREYYLDKIGLLPLYKALRTLKKKYK